MTPREAHHNSHYPASPALVVDCDNADACGKNAQLKSSHRLVRTSSLFQDGTGFARPGRARRFASNSQVQSRDCMHAIHTIPRLNSCSFPVALSRGFSCVQYRGRRSRPPSKPSVQMDGTPTKWSDRSFPTSHTRFGLTAPRQMSRRSVAAPCALRNVTSLGIANGPEMRSQQSFPKSSNVTRCAT
jgi:hypothetical protein